MHYFFPRIAALAAVCIIVSGNASAQVKLGDNPGTLEPGALLELSNGGTFHKGLLLPRVGLTSTATWGLDGSGGAAQKGMMIYNTNPAITGVSAQGIGCYSWDGTQWRAMVVAGTEWSINGNAGTTPGTNFLGTTDDHGMALKVNNRNAGRIENSTSGNNNTAFGALAADSLTTGAGNSAIGVNALIRNKTGNGNVALGIDALRNNVQSKSVAVGDSAMYSFNSAFAIGNTAVGSKALFTTQTGRKNTALGFQAGMTNNNGSNNVFVGEQAGATLSGSDYNTIVGDSAAALMTGGSGSVIIGYLASASKTGGLENVIIGKEAGRNNGGSNQNLFIGTRAGFNPARSAVSGNQNQFIGYNAGYNQSSGVQNLFEGFQSGFSSTGGWQNTYIGHFSGFSGNVDTNNVFVGNGAGYYNQASRNQFVGFNAGFLNTSGTENHFDGYVAGGKNTTGGANTAAGFQSLSNNSTGNNNVALGYHAGDSSVTGNNNTFIGYKTNSSSTALSNATAIGSNAIVGASNSLVLGGLNANAVNVGIGTSVPSSTLHVLGEVLPPMVTIEAGATSSAADLRSGTLRFGFSESTDKRGADIFVKDDEVHIAPWKNATASQDTSGFIVRPDITDNHYSASKHTAYPGMYSAATFVNYGSYAGQVKVISGASTTGGAYTPELDDNVLLVNADANISILLPPAGQATGRYLTVKRVTGGANTLTLNAGTSKIDGATTMSIPTQYQFVTLVNDGTNWFVVAK